MMPCSSECGRRLIPTTSRLAELGHRVTLTALLLCLLPVSATASCWKISVPGEVISASDMWQIRNHSSGEFSLLGSSNDERHAVSLEQVQSLSVDTNVKTSWISGNRRAANILIQTIDGQSIKLLSEMTLYYTVDGKRQTLPIRNVLSARRCADESTPVAQIPSLIPPTSAARTMIMRDGDVLFGKIGGERLDWQTSYATVAFKPAEIKSIRTRCETPATGILVTVAGDILNGRFLDTSLTFHLTTGQTIDIPTKRILTIDVASQSPTDPNSALECRDDQ